MMAMKVSTLGNLMQTTRLALVGSFLRRTDKSVIWVSEKTGKNTQKGRVDSPPDIIAQEPGAAAAAALQYRQTAYHQ